MADKLNLTLDDVFAPFDAAGNPISASSVLGDGLSDRLNKELADFYTRMADDRVTSLSAQGRADFASQPTYGSIGMSLQETIGEAVGEIPDPQADIMLGQMASTLSDLNTLLESLSPTNNGNTTLDALKDEMRKRGLNDNQIQVQIDKLIKTVMKINGHAIQTAQKVAIANGETPAPSVTPDDDVQNVSPPQPPVTPPQPVTANDDFESMGSLNGTTFEDALEQDYLNALDPEHPSGVFQRVGEFYDATLSQHHSNLPNNPYITARMALLTMQDKEKALRVLNHLKEGGTVQQDLDNILRTEYRTGVAIDALSNKLGVFFETSFVTSGGQSFELPDEQPQGDELPAATHFLSELDRNELYKQKSNLRFQYDRKTFTQTNGRSLHMHATRRSSKDDMIAHGMLMLETLKAQGRNVISFNGPCKPEFIEAIIEAYKSVDGVRIDMNSLSATGLDPLVIEAAKAYIKNIEAQKNGQDVQPVVIDPLPVRQPVNVVPPPPVTPAPTPVPNPVPTPVPPPQPIQAPVRRSSAWARFGKLSAVGLLMAAAGYLGYQTHLHERQKKPCGCGDDKPKTEMSTPSGQRIDEGDEVGMNDDNFIGNGEFDSSYPGRSNGRAYDSGDNGSNLSDAQSAIQNVTAQQRDLQDVNRLQLDVVNLKSEIAMNKAETQNTISALKASLQNQSHVSNARYDNNTRGAEDPAYGNGVEHVFVPESGRHITNAKKFNKENQREVEKEVKRDLMQEALENKQEYEEKKDSLDANFESIKRADVDRQTIRQARAAKEEETKRIKKEYQINKHVLSGQMKYIKKYDVSDQKMTIL